MSIIKFSPLDHRLIEETASLRSDGKAEWDANNAWAQHGASSIERHRLGVCGEVAAARILGVPIDVSHEARGDADRGDLCLGNKSAQVKFRNGVSYDYALRGRHAAEFRAEFGILVLPATQPAKGDHRVPDEVDVVGYITREEFTEVAVVDNFGNGLRLVARRYRFHPIEELVLRFNNYRFWTAHHTEVPS